MQAQSQSLAQARCPLGIRGCRRNAQLPKARAPLVRAAASRPDSNADAKAEVSVREKAAILLTGFAATCLAFNATPALATEAATATAAPPSPPVAAAAASAPAAAAASPAAASPAAAAPAATATAAPKPQPSPSPASSDPQADLERKNAETLAKFAAELEASQAAAIRSVDGLQKRLASEHAQMLRLQGDLRASKSQLEASKVDLQAAQKEAELEKQLLTVAKKQAGEATAAARTAEAGLKASKAELEASKVELEGAKSKLASSQKEVESEKVQLVAAKKAAADAAAAARAAESALKGQAGLEGLKTPLGMAAASGWGVAAIVALLKKKGSSEIDWDNVDGNELLMKAKEQARAQVAEPLRRELAAARDQARNDVAAAKAAARNETEAVRKELAVARAAIQGDTDSVRRELTSARDAARAEAASMRRDLAAAQGTLAQLNRELEQEREQSDALREAILILEDDVAGMESRMLAAKSEAFELQARLDEVLDGSSPSSVPRPTMPRPTPPTPPAPKTRPTVNAAAAAATARTQYNNGSSRNGSSLNGSSGGGSGRAVRVKFTLQQELPFGQSLKLVGSHPALGSWEESKGPMMTWSEGHCWQTEIPLPAGTAVEFKAVRVSPDSSEWEDGLNHVVLVPASGSASMGVQVEWGQGTATVPTHKGGGGGGSNGSGGHGGSSNGANGTTNGSSNGANGSSLGKADLKNGKATVGASNKWRGLLG